MKEFTIRIPEGWVVRFVCWLIVLCIMIFVLPFWWVKWNAYSVIERARAESEAQQITGGCKP